MKVYGIEYTKREFIYLILILILTIAFFLNVRAYQKDINEQKKVGIDCIEKLIYCERGIGAIDNLNINWSDINGINQT